MDAADDRIPLSNSVGKDDSIALRFKLTEGSSVVGFAIGCDQPAGCEGNVSVKLKTPEPCALFPSEPRCGIARTNPLSLDVLSATIVSTTEGERTIPLRIESGDGTEFTKAIAAAFTANGGEEVEVTIEKIAGTPDLTIEVKAEWKSKVDPNAAINELNTFLGTVRGLTYQEIGTATAGYRAFLMQYEQPLDHNNPMLGTFKQQFVLHHKDKAAPMVLYTSGYALFSYDEMSELGGAMGANQISTEQRWFGPSRPADLSAESWKHVNIEQAANDHHRIVEALEPFYSGKWVSTGHSKGGMTSIFHRRFFPQDVDATVAYVAPISFAYPDSRYHAFLDQIGTTECRTAIRAVQTKAFESIDTFVMMAQAEHGADATFVRSGGLASAIEKDILGLEWSFWQYRKASDCESFMAPPTDVAGLYELVATNAGVGAPDTAYEDDRFLAYQYQAATELGMQSYATSHVSTFLQHAGTQINQVPQGTMPAHTRAAMDDIQNWVKTEASQMIFLYGESDPWTGGAYEIGMQADVLKVTAPAAPHGAMISDLTSSDRDATLDKLEAWMGVRPLIGTVGPNPHVPMPWMR